MVESSAVHSSTTRHAASWQPGTGGSAASKKVVITPSAAEASPTASSVPPAQTPQVVQAPCPPTAVGVQAIPSTVSPAGSGIQIYPYYQPAYTTAEQAKLAFPSIQGAFQSPQQVIIQGQAPTQALLSSIPQAVAGQPLVSSDVHALHLDGIRQLQAAPLPVYSQLPQPHQPQRLEVQQQLWPYGRTTLAQMQCLPQGVPVHTLQAVSVAPPGGVKTAFCPLADGSLVRHEQQRIPTAFPLNFTYDATTLNGGSPHMVVHGVQPGVNTPTCTVPLCPGPCGTLLPPDTQRLITQSASPVCVNLMPAHQQFGTPHASVAVPTCFNSGQHLNWPLASPGAVVLPSKLWEPQGFVPSNPLGGGTQIHVVSGTPVSSLCCVGPPTASVTVGAPIATQDRARVYGCSPLLRTLPLGDPSSGAVQLLQTDSRLATCPGAFPTSINVAPSSLATLIPGDTFNRRRRDQPAGTSRCRGINTQPLTSCCIPAGDSL